MPDAIRPSGDKYELAAQRAGEPQRPMTSAALGAVVVLGGLLTFIATKVLLTVLSWF